MASEASRLFDLDERLRLALTDPCLVEWDPQSAPAPPVCDAAFELAVALGLFPLFGVTAEEGRGDGVLQPAMAKAAAEGGRALVVAAVRDARTLDDRITEIETAAERDDLLVGVLRQRLDLEASLHTLHDSIAEAKVHGDFDYDLGAEVSLLKALIEKLDDELDQYADTFCLVAETFWPENIGQLLPPGAWQPRPWWLTDELQERYRRLMTEAERIDRIADKMVLGLTIADDAVHLPKSTDAVDAEIGLALAADDRPTRRHYPLLAATAENAAVSVTFEITVAGEYAGRTFESLKETTDCMIVLTVRALVSRKEEDGTPVEDRQRWRMRFGGLVRDIDVESLDEQTWVGALTDLKIGQLRRARHAGRWCQLYLRRRG